MSALVNEVSKLIRTGFLPLISGPYSGLVRTENGIIVLGAYWNHIGACVVDRVESVGVTSIRLLQTTITPNDLFDWKGVLVHDMKTTGQSTESQQVLAQFLTREFPHLAAFGTTEIEAHFYKSLQLHPYYIGSSGSFYFKDRYGRNKGR